MCCAHHTTKHRTAAASAYCSKQGLGTLQVCPARRTAAPRSASGETLAGCCREQHIRNYMSKMQLILQSRTPTNYCNRWCNRWSLCSGYIAKHAARSAPRQRRYLTAHPTAITAHPTLCQLSAPCSSQHIPQVLTPNTFFMKRKTCFTTSHAAVRLSLDCRLQEHNKL
jgi:hypothetical protein